MIDKLRNISIIDMQKPISKRRVVDKFFNMSSPATMGYIAISNLDKPLFALVSGSLGLAMAVNDLLKIRSRRHQESQTNNNSK